MNRKKSVEGIRKNSMAHLDLIFDDNHMCDIKWCYKKRIEEDKTMSVDDNSEKMKVGYYRRNVKDKCLYEKVFKKYNVYTT